MALRVEMKNFGDSIWKNVTSKTVKADFKVREGFSSIGTGADLAKMTIIYKANDLASAAVFHTTAKQVRVYEGDTKVFEGYTEGSASVQTSRRSDDAWVKITAYPYLKILEKAKNPQEIIVFDAWASNPAQTTHSILHILWNAMLSSVEAINPLYRSLIENTYTVELPTIGEFRSIYRLDADTMLYSEFSKLVGEFSYTHWLDGFTVRFSKPYANDYRQSVTIGFEDLLENPAIKSAPYKNTKRPVIKLAKVTERFNQTVYRLREDFNEDSGIENIEIGKSYPEEGTATISYSIKDASDTVEFYYAQDPVVTYESFTHDNPTDRIQLLNEVWNVGGTEAEIRLKNNTSSMVDINQIEVKANRVFVIDRNTVIDSEVDGDTQEIEPKFLNSVEFGREYMNALVAENKASSSSLTFSSGKLTGIKPNTILEIGDIPALYLVRAVETDVVTGISKYDCVMLDLDEAGSKVKTYLGNNPNMGMNGKDGESNTFSFAWSSSPDRIDSDVDIYTWDGTSIMINGISIGNMVMDEWNKLVSTPPEGKPYLWMKINDGAEFRMTGKKGEQGEKGEQGDDAEVYQILSINPKNPIRNDYINGSQTVVFTANIKNVEGASPVWTVNGASVGKGKSFSYSLPYRYPDDTLTVGLYDSTVDDENKKDEMIINIENVSQSPIYEGAKSDSSFIDVTYSDGYVHSFLWTGNDGNYKGVNMKKGYPVIWNGGAWITQTEITVENSRSLFQMISDGQNLKDSDGNRVGVFSWFENLVAKTAAIENLFSKKIILLENGSIQSENYGNSTAQKKFKISSDGSAEFFNAVLNNVSVQGDKASIDCPSFAGKKSTASVTSYSYSFPASSAKTQFEGFWSSNAHLKAVANGMVQCTFSINSAVKYTDGSNFYDGNYNVVERIYMYTSGGIISRDYYVSTFENKSGTLKIDVGKGDVFIIKNIPTSLSQCTDIGQVYSDSGTLKIKMS